VKRNTLPIFGIYILIIIHWIGCATTGVLTGGPRDETPPVLIKEKSSENFRVNNQDRSFYLEFDEYIKVEDVFNQIVVSPPLIYNPKVEARSRKVVFTFNEKEVLRDSTTYTVNFGEAIRDLNENNKTSGIRYVFSTGPVIDSMQLSGIITDAITGDPVDGALALLYDMPGDSMVLKERPFYFGRADKSGQFKIENIKAGKYQLVGLKDENQNYKFDDPKELVGFTDSMLIVNESVKPQMIEIFAERQKSFVENIDSTTRGLIKIRFSQDLFLPKLTLEDSTVININQTKAKEISLWHESPERTRWWLKITQADGSLDSVRIRSYPLDPELAKTGLSCVNPFSRRNTEHPDSIFHLGFNIPVKAIEGDSFLLISKKDTTFSKYVSLPQRPDDPFFDLSFSPVFEEGDFILQFQKGQLTDWYGRILDTTLNCPIKLLPKDNFSNLKLSLEGFDPSIHYILKILKKEDIIKEWKLNETESWEGTFSQLKPDEYKLFIIEDSNGNGRWDSGNFLKRKKPERKRTIDITPLRANWDIEQDIDLSDWYRTDTLEIEEEEEADEIEEEEEEGEGGGRND